MMARRMASGSYCGLSPRPLHQASDHLGQGLHRTIDEALVRAAESQDQPAPGGPAHVAIRQSHRVDAPSLRHSDDLAVVHARAKEYGQVQPCVGVADRENTASVTAEARQQGVAPDQVDLAHPPNVPGEMTLPQEVGQYDLVQRRREELDIFSPTLYQVVLTDFLREGHFARHVRRMRKIYLVRRNALLASLRRYARGVLAIGNADAGLHLPVFLRPGVDDREVVRVAKGRGINAMALSDCYMGGPPRSGLILGFGGADERLIDG